jgi:hypothetical protein
MRIIHLAFKDLLQVLHDRKSVIFLVLMPIAFTLFFGYIMSGSISDPRLPVGWINADEESTLSADLFHMLEMSNVIRPVPLEVGEASRASDQVRDEKLAAALSVPPGFGAQAMSGEAVPITVVPPRLAGWHDSQHCCPGGDQSLAQRRDDLPNQHRNDGSSTAVHESRSPVGLRSTGIGAGEPGLTRPAFTIRDSSTMASAPQR